MSVRYPDNCHTLLTTSFLIIIYYGFCRRLVARTCAVVKTYVIKLLWRAILKNGDRIYGIFSYKEQYSIQNQGYCIITSRGNNYACANVCFIMKLIYKQYRFCYVCTQPFKTWQSFVHYSV